MALSPILLDILRAYIKKVQPRPLVYVFEGLKPGHEYSHRSAQQLFSKRTGESKDLQGNNFSWFATSPEIYQTSGRHVSAREQDFN